MSTRIDIVAGFLESGKTKFINEYLRNKQYDDKDNILLIVLEEGFTEYSIPFSSKNYIKIERFKDINCLTKEYLKKCSNLYNYILIEYNGTWNIEEFLDIKLPYSCYLGKIYCLVNADTFDVYFRNIDSMVEQIINSDEFYISGSNSIEKTEKITSYIRALQPSADIFYIDESGNYKKIFPLSLKLKNLIYRIIKFVIVILFFLLLLGVKIQIIKVQDINDFNRMFFGIILQAIPFLLIGIVLSSCIQFLVSEEKFIYFASRHKVLSYPIFLFMDCILPLCDCAMVPITEKFIQKGLKVSHAMTFFCISSSINPIVILATIYAFPENNKVIWIRILVSIMLSALVGISFYFVEKNKNFSPYKKNKIPLFNNIEYEITKITKKGKKFRFLALGIHIGNEFLRIMMFIIIGAFISTIAQILKMNPAFSGYFTNDYAFLYMFFASVFLSICASSNAFIAKGFTNSLPLMSVIPFMVFGPLLDIKNLIVMSSRFSKKFMTIFIIILLVCYIMYFVFFNMEIKL
ncbi:TPA: GTPase [Clostridioides difficile]|nr:GTPase [Clostridioides difficile]